MKSSIILGYPKSGRFSKIKAKIKNYENIEEIRFDKTTDILILDYKLSLDEVKQKLDGFLLNNSIELINKYCIYNNLDFSSLEKQEVFLKYLEDSSIVFYFTVYDINKIKSKALLSRVLIKKHILKENAYENLSEILKIVYDKIKDDFRYSSLSQIEIWNLLYEETNKIIDFKNSYMENKEIILEKIKSCTNYPLEYILEIYLNYLIQKIQQKYFKNKSFSKLFNVLIRQYSKSKLLTLSTLSLFIDSSFLIYSSYINGNKHE